VPIAPQEVAESHPEVEEVLSGRFMFDFLDSGRLEISYCRAIQHSTFSIKTGAVTWTIPAFLYRIPRYQASEMSTYSGAGMEVCLRVPVDC
jgi:hypothetical protein